MKVNSGIIGSQNFITNDMVWKKVYIGSGDGYQNIYDMCKTQDNNFIIVGTFGYSGTYMNFFGNNFVRDGSDFFEDDLFVVKINSEGDLIWHNKSLGNFQESANRVSALTDGGAIISGYFEFNMSLDSISLTGDSSDAFIAKINNNGQWEWAKKISSPDFLFITQVSEDLLGNLFITGNFSKSITFGSTTINSSWSSRRPFIAKADSNGNCLWIKEVDVQSNLGTNNSGGLSVTNDNGAIVTGNFYGQLTLGSTTLTSPNNPTNSSYNIFVAKIDSSGNWIWAKQSTGQGGHGAGKIIKDLNENFILYGSFNSTEVISLGSFNLSGSNSNIFVAKIDSSGNWIWAKHFGSDNPIFGSINITQNNGAIVYINANSSNNQLTIFETVNKNVQGKNFVAELNQNGGVEWYKTFNSQFCQAAQEINVNNFFICGNFDGVLRLGGYKEFLTEKTDLYVSVLGRKND